MKEGSKYENAASVADLAGATCTSQQSTIWYDTCLPQIPDANILAATASAPDMLMSLNADKCDLVVTDQPTGKGALVAYPNFKMLEFGGGENDFQVTDEDINIGIAMKKGNTELKEAIDSVLSQMTEEDFSAMMDEAISVQPLANYKEAPRLCQQIFTAVSWRYSTGTACPCSRVQAPACRSPGGNPGRMHHRLCRGCDPDHSLREGGQPHKAGGSLGNQGYPERLRGVLSGNSMMAQAMFIWYGLMPLLGINSTIQQAAYFILSINTGAYMAETVRGGILSIDPGQTEGAKSIGMTHVQTMLYVILPQALRNIMPQIGNNLIINIKDSCVLSVIGVAELLYKTKAAAGALYMNFETYTITMIMYFIMTFTCSRILRWWEKRMDGAENFDLATTDTLAHTSGMSHYPDPKKKEDA